jgi:hypothetical protein
MASLLFIGTFVHTPRLGEVEILRDHLLGRFCLLSQLLTPRGRTRTCRKGELTGCSTSLSQRFRPKARSST